MKILFVAKHGPDDNQDEDAVTHALRELGHTVICLQEKRFKRHAELAHIDADLCLFFKWPVVSEIAETAKRMPCAFYYFDMVRSVVDDPTLHARSLSRMQWMRDVLPHVIAGFCTDGDWVADQGGKLVHLMQGADERTACLLPYAPEGPPILFTGMVNHGQRRAEHVAQLRERYGDKFGVLGDAGPRHRIHGSALAKKFAACKVVVAPDGPSTDLYWSNRVYLTTGLGGYLVHPYCSGLERQYSCGDDMMLPMYTDRAECIEFIDAALADERLREASRREMHEWTMKYHTYRHRCEEIVRICKERM